MQLLVSRLGPLTFGIFNMPQMRVMIPAEILESDLKTIVFIPAVSPKFFPALLLNFCIETFFVLIVIIFFLY